jgi:phosphoglucosamine mutase
MGGMRRLYFGTDGIRGTANTFPITADVALRVGMAAGRQFTRGDHRHRVVIGKDTRLSGYMLEAAMTAGFLAVGMDVTLLGPMPTPAVAMLTQSLRADLGVMLSASHNFYQDNGIKLFGPDGYKLSDEIELQIEARMENGLDTELVAPAEIGRARRLDDALGRYIEFVKNSFPRGRRLDGLKIVIDCANGAAYKVAPVVLWELEAQVIPVGVAPDGLNINRGCGSTRPEFISEQVVAHGADLGIALDGDADRVIMVDADGHVIDGDQLMAAIADHWHDSGRLAGGGIVATVMSNLGLERHLKARGLKLVRSAVGDRYVVDAMRANGMNFGGEQSGHLVLSDFGTTGDGLIAALQVLALMVASERPLAEICQRFTPMPQVLRNVRFNGRSPLEDSGVKAAIESHRRELGDRGRVLIRQSGTEPLIRVMVEGEDESFVSSAAQSLSEVIAGAARHGSPQ